jgi:YVTN family beta-propeller protein
MSDVGARPWGIGVSPDGKNAYLATESSDDIPVIDVYTGGVEERTKGGGRPWGGWS